MSARFSRTWTALSLLSLSAAFSLAACGGDSTGTGGSGGHGGTGGTGGTGGSGPPPSYDCTAPSGAFPALKLTQLTTNVPRPVLLRGVPGDDTRIFIVSQFGQIYILKDGVQLPTPFLDVSGISVQPQGGDERGLLGLAFHPGFADNGRFFIYYTDQGSGHQIIAEYNRSSDNPNIANPTPVQTLLDLDDPESNHNGGMLAFSPMDGFLYIGTGDGGGAGDQHGTFGNGQNLASLWGKILRVDVDSKMPYAIPAGNMTTVPAGNPTTGAVQKEIWDYGVRNPWRFSFDLCTNDLYIGDVGQNTMEEIDVEPAGMGNRNYGWRAMEGTHCYDANLGCDLPAYTPPVATYDHNAGCSISGGFVYRGSKIPGLRGTYFYGDYCSGRIWSFSWAPGPNPTVTEHSDELMSSNTVPSYLALNIVSFGQDNAGEMYVVDLNGRIYLIEAQ